jgi:hydrocephalus-inducing protein
LTTFSEDVQKLGNFRWIVPAHSEITLRLRFTSEELGQFDQTLNFELVGTKRRYQIYCRGVCAFPTISREPRIVFNSRKKNKKFEEIVSKKYILSTEVYEFGPLHCEKVLERVKAGQYPENVDYFTISNTSPMVCDVSFSFLSEAKPEPYSMEPNFMSLNPGESQRLTLWAHPRQPGRFEDSIVCCVRENP